MTGLSEPVDLRTMHAALNSGQLPADPKPGFLTDTLKTRQKTRRLSRAFLLGIAGLNLLIAIVNRDAGLTVLAVAFVIAVVFVNQNSKKIITNTQSLLEQLKPNLRP